jgi:hypothetical protein
MGPGHHLGVSLILGGQIRTKVGTCSYYEAFKYEGSSYILSWAANKTHCWGGSTYVSEGHAASCGAAPKLNVKVCLTFHLEESKELA